jgi:hypothetical protein
LLCSGLKSEAVITMQNQTTTTHQQVQAAFGILKAVTDTIRELGEVPSGHLYTQVMSTLTLAQYEQVIETLKSAGLVRESNSHLLTWLGAEPK